MKIVFCTQNMAPFRMRWMDEIAKYEEVVIYQLGEYETGVNPKYISYVPFGYVLALKSNNTSPQRFFSFKNLILFSNSFSL